MISESELLDRLLEHPAILLILDYDGTLAEFAPTPDHVEPDRTVVSILSRLSASDRVAVAVLSGRRLAAVESLVPIEGIFLAGSYGIEIKEPGGGRVDRMRREEVRPFLDRLLPRWIETIEGKEGFFLEDKGWSLAIHARAARAGESSRTMIRARERAEAIGIPSSFRLMGDDRFLEMAPRAANKSDGTDYLLQRMAAGRRGIPAYLGDDDKDIEAFDAVHKAGGCTAIVGDRFPEADGVADCRFGDPASVRAWLRLLADRL